MSPTRINSPWFTRARPDPNARLRLFCFPYAGGGAAIYRGWENYLPPGVEIFAVQPPGRGGRFKEPALDRMDSLVAAVATAMQPFLDRPIVLFGHSVGAFASFEMAYRLADTFGIHVQHLFVSGARAPQLPRNRKNIHDLSEEDFITELKTLNGTPPEVLENPELMRMVSATLRADFAIAETYRASNKHPLNCPMSVFGGLEDTLAAREDLEAWKVHTTNSFDLWQLPGDHFFIHTSDSLILRILSRELSRIIKRD
ncbi:MAG TPA: alpha/beta fold hydrolase [Pyrinomonadaceae bacterium]|nr:alpha/beta fold hydrolase [Pyrinomonadaceae bacterium]